eukprot:gene24092-9666_t
MSRSNQGQGLIMGSSTACLRKCSPSWLPTSTAGTDNGLFNRLPTEVQPIVAPCLNSRFTLEDNKAQRGGAADEPSTIFGSFRHSFRRWLELWLKSIIGFTSGSCQPAFSAVTSVLKWDLPFMTFLLPQVVHNVIAYGSTSARDSVLNEMNAVLLAGQKQDGEAVEEMELYLQGLFTLLDVLSRWVKDESDTQLALFTLLDVLSRWVKDESDTLLAGSLSSTASKQSKNALFTLLDVLSRWVKDESDTQLALFTLLDVLSRWVKDESDTLLAGSLSSTASKQSKNTYARVDRGGGLNPAAFKTVEYTSQQVTFLLEVYGQLEEPDGLSGLVQLRQGGLTTTDQILAAEKAGAWSDALALYEHALRKEGSSVGEGTSREEDGGGVNLANSSTAELQSVGHLQALVKQVDGLLGRQPEGGAACMQLAACGVAAAWRMGNWSLLREYLTAGLKSLSANEQWDVRVGDLLQDLNGSHSAAVNEGLKSARSDIMSILPTISMESYVRAYPHVTKLHMLQEIQDVMALKQEGSEHIDSLELKRRLREHIDSLELKRRLQWMERLAATQATLATQEPVLSLRRQLAEMLGNKADAGACWLQYAKLCRATGHHEAAATATLEALAREVPGSVIERAKLLWNMGKQHLAISELEGAMRRFAENPKKGGASMISPNQRHLHAKLALQRAKWVAIQGQLGYSELRKLFEEAIQIDSKWEKGYFLFARYLDKLHDDAKRRQKLVGKDGKSKTGSRLGNVSHIKVALGEELQYYEYLPHIITFYGRSIEAGYRHILQSMPRLLTLYCDFGNEQVTKKGVVQQKERNSSNQVTNLMRNLMNNVSPVAWLQALPQLISRICHPCKEVQEVIQNILIKVTETFPQQALWSLAGVSKSSIPLRSSTATGIQQLARKNIGDAATLRLFEQFMNLVMVPIQEAFNVPLPPVPGATPKQQYVTIQALRETIT